MPGFRNFRRRYLSLPSRSAARITHDVEEELRLHIEMRAAELEREGRSPAEARAEAMRKFGDLADATRYCADVDRDSERRRRTSNWLADLRYDASHTFRLLRRSPAFAVATVLTLALASAASTAVYGVLHTYLLRPLPFPDAERLVSVTDGPSMDRFPDAPSLRAVDWTGVDSLFDATAAWDLDGFTILGGAHAENVTGAWVSPGYARALGMRVALGRGFREEEYRETAPVVIISHGLWMRRFGGDSGVVGSTVTMHATDRPDAATVVTIVGVTPNGFWPIQWREGEVLRPFTPGGEWMPSLAKLKIGVSRVATQGRLDAFVRAQLHGEIDARWHMTLIPWLERHSARARPVLFMVFGAALFMFLAACGSVAGALVSRMAARRNELAVRLALGGGRARIVRQLLTESLVLATLAGVLGLAIAYGLLVVAGPAVQRLLGTMAPGGAVAFRPTASTMLLSVAVSSLAGIALGTVPALTFLRSDRKTPAFAVLGAGRSNSARGAGARVRRVLIAGQVAIAMVLLFGAGLMFRTIARMQATEVGFRVDGVFAGSLLLPRARYADSASKRQGMERVLSEVTRTTGIRNAALVFPRPFGSAWRMPVFAEGAATTDETAPKTMVYTVSPSYFATMDLPLRHGRTFTAGDDHVSPLVIVVSEALARRLAPNEDVVGRRVRVRVPYLPSFDDDDKMPLRTIVGVVGDTQKEFAPNGPPDVYVPYAQNPRSMIAMVVRTDAAEATMFEPAKQAVSKVDPALALSGVETLAASIADEGGQRRGLSVLLGVFAAFSLGLSALALYASLSYAVVQRRAELAVRMAVGADARSILRLVVGEGLAVTLAGAVLGAIASLALGRVLANQLYGVATRDPLTLVAISLVLGVAVVAACAVPGMRAVGTDPALALRE
ncbi:MAG TPA: ADOP family duplicated permease [Gemmatimonadaceae bacterium]|nr:ADOP family duplicated permease [Gemmatimonadaceae bacterium]